MRALCAYALKLTRNPAGLSESDLGPLRAVGFEDRAIVDANQVVSYFNYVNRIADGLGVELEDEWPAERRAERRYPLGRPTLPLVSPDELPWLTVAQMREVDRLMTQEIGITLEQMMENAGRALAMAAARLLEGASGRSIVVLAGPGGNGGGGMVAARHLLDAGADVEVALPTERLTGTPRRQLEILRAVGLQPRLGLLGDRDPDLVLDALLGYSQSGPPRARWAELIRWTAPRRTLSLDVPSGLELETGTLHEPHVTAEETVTLALPKQGLKGSEAAGAVGRLLLADIGVSAIVYERIGVSYRTPFREGPLVQVAGHDTRGKTHR